MSIGNSESKIVAHHVGGRGFGVAFNCPAIFSSDILHILYEADPDCAKEMIVENDCADRLVFPYCLGRDNYVSKLYVTANPYASSNLPPNPKYGDYTCEVRYNVRTLSPTGEARWVEDLYDAIYGKENCVVKEVNVDIKSLDKLFLDETIGTDFRPDFLSLDTQGSEHDIMVGAKGVIASSVLGVVTEIEFHPMYQGQKLFSNILDFMHDQGFYFAGFTHLQEISPYRASIGYRAKGFLAFGDALFLRDLQTLNNLSADESKIFMIAQKLAFISLVFGQVEYGLKVLDFASKLVPNRGVLESLESRAYYKFLCEVVGCMDRDEKVYLPTQRCESRTEKTTSIGKEGPASHTLPSTKASYFQTTLEKIRIMIIDKPQSIEGRIRHLIFRRPHEAGLKMIAYALSHLARSSQPAYRMMRQIYRRFLSTAPPVTPPSGSPSSPPIPTYFETLLNSYGFTWVEYLVRERRVVAKRDATQFVGSIKE